MREVVFDQVYAFSSSSLLLLFVLLLHVFNWAFSTYCAYSN